MSPTDSEPPRARVAEARRNRQTNCGRHEASVKFETSLVRGDCQAAGGIGTLYRHFPTREALVEAVYHDQETTATGALELLARTLRQKRCAYGWTYSSMAVTKHGMIDTLRVIISSGRLESLRCEQSWLWWYVCSSTPDNGREIRPDADAETIAATLAGILTVAGETSNVTRLLAC